MTKIAYLVRNMLAALALLASPAGALDFSLGISGTNVDRFDYEIGLLELALEKADGNHSISIVTLEDTPRSRMVTLLANGNTAFDIMVTGITRERHALLRTVPVPLTRGLLGYRILIVCDDPNGQIGHIETLDDLKKLAIGSGTDWPDTLIMRDAGLNITAADYENLFKMVSLGRIKGFARGVLEPYIEIANRAEKYPNLKVDETIAIVYPFDAFFFVNRQDEERYRVVLQGLERAYEDGSFLKYFKNSEGYKYATKHARLSARRQFALKNRTVPDLMDMIPCSYWHDSSLTN